MSFSLGKGSTPEEIAEKIRKAGEEMVRAAGVALYAAGNNIALSSMQKTPVDTGNLRASHYVTHPQRDAKSSVFVEVGAGTTAESYAVEQHENMGYHHEEGEAKFMETAIREERANIPAMLQSFMAQALEQGTAPSEPPSFIPATPTAGTGTERIASGAPKVSAPRYSAPPKAKKARSKKPKSARAERRQARRKLKASARKAARSTAKKAKKSATKRVKSARKFLKRKKR